MNAKKGWISLADEMERGPRNFWKDPEIIKVLFTVAYTEDIREELKIKAYKDKASLAGKKDLLFVEILRESRESIEEKDFYTCDAVILKAVPPKYNSWIKALKI